jgi:hypothetical protein
MPVVPYGEVDYQNLPSLATPVNAENLNSTDDQAGLLTGLFISMQSILGNDLIPDFESFVGLMRKVAQTYSETGETWDYLDLTTNPMIANQVARLFWSTATDTLNINHSGDVIQQVGEETFIYTTNTTGTTIHNGELIGLDPNTTGIVRYLADGNTSPIYFLGVATQEIPAGEKGRLTVFGRVRSLNTSSFAFRKDLYASPSIAGTMTNTKPTAPNVVLTIGLTTTVHASDGEIFVRPIIERQSYFGSFFRLADATLGADNTATPIQFTNTALANGVSIHPTIASRIVIANSGLYSCNFSCQLVSTSSSLKNVKIWLAVNGVAVPNSTMRRAVETGTAVTVQTRTTDLAVNAGDYLEIMWASDNTNVILDHVVADAVAPFAPATPAASLQVIQVQQ